jgi:hypothetical protein
MLALLGFGILGTIVFVVAKILETMEQIKFARYLASGIVNKDKLIAVIPDDDDIASTIIVDIRANKSYTIDRRDSASGKAILKTCKKNAKIYDLADGLFLIDNNYVNEDEVFNLTDKYLQ